MRILCLSLYVYISLPLPHCNSTCTDSPPIQYASFKKKKKILFLFRERGREKQGEKHRCTRYFDWSPLACPQLGTWPLHPRHVPWPEMNHQPLGSQARAQSTEPYCLGHLALFPMPYYNCFLYGLIQVLTIPVKSLIPPVPIDFQWILFSKALVMSCLFYE